MPARAATPLAPRNARQAAGGPSTLAAAGASANFPQASQRQAPGQLGAALVEATLASVKTGNDARVSELVESGADVDSKDSDGLTPLVIVSRDNRPSTAKILLAAKADPNVKTRRGGTALVAAATNGHAGAFAHRLVDRPGPPAWPHCISMGGSDRQAAAGSRCRSQYCCEWHAPSRLGEEAE